MLGALLVRKDATIALDCGVAMDAAVGIITLRAIAVLLGAVLVTRDRTLVILVKMDTT